MMQPADSLTLQAFLVALDQLEDPLDPDIQTELSQIIKQIRQISQKCSPLQVQYDQAMIELKQNYSAQSRHKKIEFPTNQSSPQKNLSAFLRNSPLYGAELDLSRDNS
jgi:hypothetical protein